MKALYHTLTILLAFSNSCMSQAKYIDYEISTDTLVIDPRNPIAQIEFRLKNNTDEDYVLYGFSNVEPLYISLESIKNNDCVVGNRIHITQNKMVRKPNSIFDEDFTPYESVLKSNMIILRGHSKISFIEKINLEYFELEPWEYKLSLVYYSGKNINNYFTKEEISAEEKKYGATFFRGWVQSNSVPLIVRYER